MKQRKAISVILPNPIAQSVAYRTIEQVRSPGSAYILTEDL